MEIEVGEWVRTNRGLVSKVIEIRPAKRREKDIIEDVYILEKGNWTAKQLIVSHSKNRIDLIQKGDIILYDSNYLGRQVKLEVDYVRKKEEDYKWGEGWCSTCIDENIFIDDIKSIVTSQQFSSVEYLLEEE